jgi:hypothetical protein
VRVIAVAVFALAGCSEILGLDDFHRVDAAVADAAVDAPTAVLSGRVSENSVAFVADATVSFVRLPDHVTVSSTMSNSIGQYSLAVPIGTDGYLSVERTSDENTLQYLDPPVTADRSLTAFVFTPAYVDQLAAHVSITQSASAGFMLLQIRDSHQNALAGATASVSGGTPYYFDANGPETGLTMTDAGGLAVVFNLPAHPTTVTATLGSITTAPRMVSVVGASVTLLPIIVQ